MKNKDLDILFSINNDEIGSALAKLTSNLLKSNSVNLANCKSIWDAVEQLDDLTFLDLKTNVYFADAMKAIRIKELSNIHCDLASEIPPQTELHHAHEANHTELTSPAIGMPKVTTEQTEFYSLPPLSTKLDMLELPGKFMKLIKRLKNISNSYPNFKLGERLYDVVTLPVVTIESLPNVGALYVQTFRDLKRLANLPDNIYERENSLDLSSIDTTNLRLSLSGLEDNIFKSLEKYARKHGNEDMEFRIEDILSFRREELGSQSGFGKTIVDPLIELRRRVEEDLQKIAQGEIDYQNFESRIIVPRNLKELPFNRLEQVLLEDIDNFLNDLHDDLADIMQKRWGYVDDKETLEELGKKLNLTRERVRQKEAKYNRIFLKTLRLHPSLIFSLIKPALDLHFTKKLPNLFSCFSSEKSFYEFLDIICDQTDLYSYVYPEIDKAILNEYFAEYGAPALREEISDYLSALNLTNILCVKNVIDYLIAQEILRIQDELIWPKNLSRSEAAACVLVKHPKGLPWLDIAKLVNSKSLSKTPIYEDRLDNEAFKYPEFIFLAGKGVYKHTSFIDSERIDLNDIFTEITKFSNITSRNVFHLNECYLSSEKLQRIGYYEVRQFVKRFGEDFGFFFDGRSQSDSIGLEKGFRNITQRDVIVEAMRNCDKPLTKPEVANLIKSKSLAHASFYLDKMIEDGEVVQVDRMLYTTPDQAYRNIDIEEYLESITRILLNHGKPVEPSIFELELNILFDKSYSKFFYSSIARLNAKSQGWFRKQSLYSVTPIPFDSLRDAVQTHCNLDRTLLENIQTLREFIAIGEKAATVAITNWKNGLIT